MEQALSCFNDNHEGGIKDVIDVGVQWGTPFLMDSFPKAKHYLVEPVVQYHPPIIAKYTENKLNFELMPFALSDTCGTLLLHEYDYDKKGRVSHSFLRSEKIENPYLVKVSDVEVSRLDNVFVDKPLDDFRFIVKIDVDGLEEKIILGGGEVLKRAALVIVEAPLKFLQQRLCLIIELGFVLWDICDPAYYYEQLHQVDLVFINKKIKRDNVEFRPWEKNNGMLVRKKWQGR
jgi:FkbM family methyltransferase